MSLPCLSFLSPLTSECWLKTTIEPCPVLKGPHFFFFSISCRLFLLLCGSFRFPGRLFSAFSSSLLVSSMNSLPPSFLSFFLSLRSSFLSPLPSSFLASLLSSLSLPFPFPSRSFPFLPYKYIFTHRQVWSRTMHAIYIHNTCTCT